MMMVVFCILQEWHNLLHGVTVICFVLHQNLADLRWSCPGAAFDQTLDLREKLMDM